MNSTLLKLTFLAIIAVVNGAPQSANWAFNGNFNDNSLNRRNLKSQVKVSWTTDPFGNKNSAAYFNRGYAVAPAGSYFPNPAQFSMSTWIKPAEHGSWSRIFDFNNGKGFTNNIVWVASSHGRTGRPSVYIADGKRWMISCVYPKALPLNRWTHVASVVDGNQIRNFVNGRIVNKCNFKNTRKDWSTKFNYVGRSAWPQNPNFKGALHDLKIYASVLSETDLARIKGHPTPLNKWQFNKNFVDSGSAKRNLITRNRASFTTDPFGSYKRAVYFNQGYAQAPAGNYFPNPKAFTVAAWVKPHRHNKWSRVIDFANGKMTDNVILVASTGTSGKPSFWIANGHKWLITCHYPKSLALNQWTHLASVVDGNQVRNYVNGRKVKTCNFKNIRTKWTTSKNYIGRSNWNHDKKFWGAMDNVQIFDSALSKHDLNNEKGEPIATNDWEFNNNLKDSGTLQRSFTSSVRASFVNDQFGHAKSAVYFNNGYAKAPAGNYFQNPGTFTVAAWVKPAKHNSWQRIIDFGNGQYNDNIVLAASYGTNGRPSMWVGKGRSKWLVSCKYPRALVLNQWTHVASVVDGNQVRNYINGKEVSKCNFKNTRTNYHTRFNYVGKSNWKNDRLFKGAMDGVQIYSVALTAHDLHLINNTPRPVFEWQFMKNLLDAGPSKRNIKTKKNLSYTTDAFGRAKSAIYLNNGYAKAPAGNYFPNPQKFTIAAWVKPAATKRWSRIIDFGNGQYNDNIVLVASTGTSGKPSMWVGKGRSKWLVSCKYPNALVLNKWTHVASVVDGNQVRNYINGKEVSKCNFNNTRTQWRTIHNYIGKSNWGHDQLFKGAIGGLQLFSKALTQFALHNLANNIGSASHPIVRTTTKKTTTVAPVYETVTVYETYYVWVWDDKK